MADFSQSTFIGGVAVFALALFTSSSSLLVQAQQVKIAKSYKGVDFEDHFNFYTGDDPTHGYVNYVSQAVAKTSKLITTTNSSFIMAVESKMVVAAGRGRDSVRIVSRDEFGDGVYVLDVNHMPVGCGTWPAFWTTTRNGWPKGGEIDIIEGSNALPPSNSSSYINTFPSSSPANLTGITLATSSTSSLHTIPECSITEPVGLQSGTQKTKICDVAKNDNQGCGVELGSGSWGEEWNDGGGGLYVMWRDFANSGRIYIYTFPRSSTHTPSALLDFSSSTLDPSAWNLTPQANFSIPFCPSNTFKNHVIVFNIALCGDLAASTFAGSGCAGTRGISCEDFVKGSPEAFGEAFWDVKSLRVYNSEGKVANERTVLKPWKTAVIAIAALIVAGSLAFLVVCLFFRYRRRNTTSTTDGTNHDKPTSTTRLSTLDPASSYNLPPVSSHLPVTSNAMCNPIFNDGNPNPNPNLSSSSKIDRRNNTLRSPSYASSASNILKDISLRRPSAPFVEKPDGTNILRRGSAPEDPNSNIKGLLSNLIAVPSFFAAPDRLTPVFARGGPPNLENLKLNSAKSELKIGDGGTAFRPRHEALPGETPAVGSMSVYNAAGASRRGRAADEGIFAFEA